MKRILLLAITNLSFICLGLAAPPDTIKVDNSDPTKMKVYYDAVLPITTSVDRRAGWSYFWMFDNGTFSRDTSFVFRQNTSLGSTKVKTAVRGRYHGDQEPPTANRTIPVGPPEIGKKMLRELQIDSICPQWRAARQGDSLFLALIMKNPEKVSKNGYLKIRFPSYYFNYKEQVFPSAIFSNMSTQSQPGSRTENDKEIRTWKISNFPGDKEFALFIRLEVKMINGIPITASLPDQLIEMEFSLTSDTQTGASNDPNADQATGMIYSADVPPKVGRASDASESAPTAVSFFPKCQTTISINYARDPNHLEVDRYEIEPTNNSAAEKFTYTMHVENLGKVSATHLRVRAFFDPLLNRSTINYTIGDPSTNHFPFGLPDTRYCPFPSGKPDSVFWAFMYANIGPDPKLIGADRSMPQQNKADYSYSINIPAGKKLVEGDSIVCRARVELMGNREIAARNSGAENAIPFECQMPFIKEDNVITAPCVIRVVAPPKVQFGSIIGLKIHTSHHYFANPDSVGSTGISLTWRFPIFRPRFDNSQYNTMKRLPHWFWQLELGYVKNDFNGLVGQGRFESEGVQLTPIQLRYIQPMRTAGKRFCIGASAGYNVAYMYKLNSGGREVSLPGEQLKRFEHEVFGSIDLQNKIDVPTLTFGLGYKIRENYMFNSSLRSAYPFAYIQFEPLRIRKGFAKWFKRVYRW